MRRSTIPSTSTSSSPIADCDRRSLVISNSRACIWDVKYMYRPIPKAISNAHIMIVSVEIAQPRPVLLGTEGGGVCLVAFLRLSLLMTR